MLASPAPPTGDLACNPGMCPDWKLNQGPFGSQAGTQSTEPHQPGLFFHFCIVCILFPALKNNLSRNFLSSLLVLSGAIFWFCCFLVLPLLFHSFFLNSFGSFCWSIFCLLSCLLKSFILNFVLFSLNVYYKDLDSIHT